MTKEKDEFFLDIFDARLNDNNEAHIESIAVNSLEEAVEYVQNYIKASS